MTVSFQSGTPAPATLGGPGASAVPAVPADPAPKPRRNSFMQDGLRLISNQLLVTLTNFASGVVLSRTLGPQGRGVIAAVGVYPTAFLNLAQMGVRQASVFYLGRRILTDQQVVSAVTALIMIMASAGILACGGALWATGNPAFTFGIIMLAVASIPVTLVEYYSTGIFLGKHLVGQLVKVERMAVLVKFLLVVLLVRFLRLDVPGALLAALLGALMVAVYALRRVSKIAPLRPRFDRKVITMLLSKGVIYSVVLAVTIFMERMEIAMMERLSTLEEIGLYTTGYAVSQLTALLPNTLSPALFSYSANASNATEFSGKVGVLLRMTLLFAVLAVAGLILVSPFLIPRIYGTQFALAADVVLLLGPATVACVYTRILSVDMAGRGHPYVALWATVPALAVQVTLDWLLIPQYGSLGAAVGSSLSQSLVACLLTVVYCKHTQLRPRVLLGYRSSDFAFVARVQELVAKQLARLTGRRSAEPPAGKGLP